MEIAIANGNPDAANATFDAYIESLADTLDSRSHGTRVLRVRDMDILGNIYERDMLNFHARLRFLHPISRTVEEVADEIDHL